MSAAELLSETIAVLQDNKYHKNKHKHKELEDDQKANEFELLYVLIVSQRDININTHPKILSISDVLIIKNN